MEPHYQRPYNKVPLQPTTNPNKKNINNISWQEFFTSPDLQRIIQLALDNNRDLKVANLNIESAQETYGISRANLLPSVNAIAFETKQGVPGAFAAFTPRKQFRANISLASYEIDFFGRLRSLKKSAMEDLLSTVEAHNVMKISVISETVNAYAQLLMDSEILQIAADNVVEQTNRYKFSELRYKNGIDSRATLLNNESLMESAKITYENYKKIVEQDKSALMILTGVFDEKSLPQISNLNEIKINEELLEFVPSESLLSRPDVKQAEHNLKSANANIGAARAAFFPAITLTGNYGYGSRELGTLLKSNLWSFTPQISLPIFNGGKNFANLKLADVRKKVQIANYEKAIQTAFKEASDELNHRQAIVNQLKSSEKILKARQKAFDLSVAQHKQGISSARDIVDTKLALLSARQDQATTKKEYIANLIMLYKALGGGSDLEN